ncbi:MAG: NAD-dependent protein deacylase [Clostridia bacterium]|jgi:NAD-dependent deacetylase
MINRLADIFRISKNITFFTGAGVSTESGIPDFRSVTGLYSKPYGKYKPEQILSHDFFYAKSDIFYDFYYDYLVNENAKPNDFHYGISKLQDMGYNVSVITQNIDNLHQMAGNRNVYELHGSIYRNNCTKCGKFFGFDYVLKHRNERLVCDECKGLVKPDVVLYEEPLHEGLINAAIDIISEADVLIVAGTSLSVYPAAQFVEYYRKHALCIMNKTVTTRDSHANFVFHDSCSITLNELIKALG